MGRSLTQRQRGLALAGWKETRSREWLATERVRLEKTGKHTPVVDGQIAAVAATNGIPIVTTNVADFSLFKGLAIHD